MNMVNRLIKIEKNLLVGLSFFVLFLLTISTVRASLDVDLVVGKPVINPMETQQVTAIANELGLGLIIVIQPSTGESAAPLFSDEEFLECWNLIPQHIKESIQNKIGDKIISFRLVRIGLGGGTQECIFPNDFRGINGDPSTQQIGKVQNSFCLRVL